MRIRHPFKPRLPVGLRRWWNFGKNIVAFLLLCYFVSLPLSLVFLVLTQLGLETVWGKAKQNYPGKTGELGPATSTEQSQFEKNKFIKDLGEQQGGGAYTIYMVQCVSSV